MNLHRLIVNLWCRLPACPTLTQQAESLHHKPWGIRVAFVAALTGAASAFAEPSLILHNGIVHTVNATNATAQAVAIEGERILAVGSNKEIVALASPATRRIDLQGGTVVPGIIDSHGHLLNLGQGLQNLDFTGTTSYEQIVAMVAAKATATPEGTWIRGRGWDQNDWAEKEFPRHQALSEVSPNHPVVLTRIDGHASLANQLALDAAGIAKDTADPDGGKILRDSDGAPTGVLIDAAQGLVERRVPAPNGADAKAAVGEAIRECLRYGITSMHDAGVSAGQIELYKQLIAEDAFPLRVYAMISANDRAALNKYFKDGPLIGYGNNRLTVRSVKAMADGALGSRGAALLEDYSDDPGNRGLSIMGRDVIEPLTTRALEAGFQVCTHAIGDRGNRETLDAYEAAFKAVTTAKDARLRIEHAQIVALDDIPRFAALGIIPSMQATHATSDMYWAEDRVGPERIKGAYAWRKFLEAGCKIANGSDFPVEKVDPLLGFHASITRQDARGFPGGGWRPEERMTRIEMLRSFTIDAAYAAFEENIKGSLEPGKLADMVVLSQDVMTIDPAKILETRVELTILGGAVVYER